MAKKTPKKMQKFPFEPVGDRLVVRPLIKPGEKRLPSGIILPESADKEKMLEGEVVAVGPGKRGESGPRIAPDVSAGDTVLFKKPWDEPLTIAGQEYYVISESDVSLIKR